MNKKNYKISSANYLLSCDFINKYNLVSVYKQPEIKKINFQIYLKDFLAASDFLNKKDINSNIQLKSIMFFYILLSSFPAIQFQNIKAGKNTKVRNEGDFILKMNITNKNQINSFLSNLFIENNSFFENLSINSSKNKLDKISELDNEILSYNIKMPGNIFFDVNDFFYTKTQDINLGKILIDTNFIYSKVPKKINLSNLIKNTYFFG
jgi:hypothetical protein